METIIRATGLKQATEAQRAACRRYGKDGMHLVAATAAAIAYPIIRPLARLIDQLNYGACAGCSITELVESVYGVPPYLSWSRMWTEARRIDGNLKNIDVGTYFTSAVQALTERGIDKEEDGELNRIAELTKPDDYDSELDAFDRIQVGTERWRMPDGDLDALDDGMNRKLGAAIATGVKNPYFTYFSRKRSSSEADVVLGTESLGGYVNGHEQAILAVDRVGGVRRYAIQNSWGDYGGCHMPDGTWQPGCVWVNEAVIRSCWDCDLIQIVKK